MEFAIYNEDCVEGMRRRLEPGSVELCVSSIPFGALFSYSGKNEDIGNNQDGIDMRAGQFGLHMRFFIESLLRVMAPGRNVCIHIQQLLRYKIQHGFMGRRDFRAAVVDLFEAGGFEWKGEVAIPKNPQIIAKRNNLHCLMFKTGKERAQDLAPAPCDFVMIFQKPGTAAAPVRALYDARTNPGGWVTQDQWIRWARGVWGDINETDVLDGWQSGRDPKDEKHVCPLQLEVIRRCIMLYTTAGELVLDPFMGIGSTAWVALGGATQAGETVDAPRRAVGFELKESYHAVAVKNAKRAAAMVTDRETDMVSLMEQAGA
jgi:DNA modification methylase